MGQAATIVLGQIGLSFHIAAAAVVAELLERDGIEVEIKQGSHEQIYQLLASESVDLVCSAWLPGSHGIYIDPIADRLEKLAVLYEPYAIWGVPDFLPRDIRAVEDLRRPDVADLMVKRIQGIGPGAGISRFSREIVDRYRLGDLGYHFENGTPEECTGAFEQSVHDGRGVVVPLWHPQFLHHRYKIRELDEPFGLLRGRDRATLIIRKSAVSRLPNETIRWMRRISLGNTEVTALDHMTSVDKVSPADAARQWLDRNSQTVRGWRLGP